MTDTTNTFQNEARYRAIFDQAAGGIVLTDLTGRFQLVNQRWCDLLGYTEAEMLQLTILDLNFPDDLVQGKKNLETVGSGRESLAIEKRYRRRDGGGVWLSVSVSPVFDAQGHPESIMAMAIDISDRKEAQAQNAFLAELGERLAPLSAADEIIAATVTELGGFLGAHRCYFVECLPSEDRIVVSRNWVRDEAPSVEGTFSLFAFGGLEWWRQYSRGDFAVTDVRTDPLTRDRLDRYEPLGVASYAVQPFHREGEWTTVLAVTDIAPRTWTPGELALLRHVIARVWPQVERARTESALQELRAVNDRRSRLYETLMSGTPDFVYTFDLEHRFSYANRALLAMFGRSWEETVGKGFLEVGYPAWHAAQHIREIDQVKNTGEMIRGEVPFHGTHGRRIYDYIFTPVFGANGEVESIAGTTRDVTEARDAVTALRKAADRRQLLGEAVTVLLTADDSTAMIEDLFALIAPHLEVDSCLSFAPAEQGEGFVRLASVGLSQALVDTIDQLVGPASLAGQAWQYHTIVEHDVQSRPDTHLALPRSAGLRAYVSFPLIADGRLLGTLAFGCSTRDTIDDDDVEFLSTVARYVTVARERLRLISELRKADQKKDHFIALLAHELRNPLAPLRNGLQVMRLAPEDPKLVASSREMMERQLGHLVRLIEDLLDVSRITLNKLALRRERVLLADVMMHAVESARPAVEAAGHELVVSLPPAPIVLDADLTRLAQVFSNLLSNSAKYTAPGGRITITATQEGGMAVVDVSDNGIGMPGDALSGIFDMFSQIDRTIERTAGGLGIGLALVRGLVMLHGGSVTADSGGAGLGSTFTVRLPVDHAAEPGSERTPGKETALTPQVRRRVLVVDDNRDAAASTCAILELLGHEVHVAHDGLDAVDRVAKVMPDLILMDVGMPRLNGYEATRRIRALPQGGGIRIVALTGWGQDSDRQESRAAGCDGHLVKPVGPAELRQMLDDVGSARRG